MSTQIKFDWDQKREEMLNRINNNPEEMKKYVLNVINLLKFEPTLTTL